jgi:DNA segregation ATPase FtsK/SpoIIIE-like protein
VLEEKRVARETRKIERVLNKKGVPPPPMSDSLFDEPIDRPEPQVIDTSVPAPKKPEPKPKKEKLVPNEPAHFENYSLPDLGLLESHGLDGRQAADPEELRAIQTILIDTLMQFGISVAPGDITKGPTITRYEVYPAKGVRVDKILALERDLARATSANASTSSRPSPARTPSASRSPTAASSRWRCARYSNPTTGRKPRRGFRLPSARTFMAKRSSPILRKCRTASWPAPPAAAKASASTR